MGILPVDVLAWFACLIVPGLGHRLNLVDILRSRRLVPAGIVIFFRRLVMKTIRMFVLIAFRGRRFLFHNPEFSGRSIKILPELEQGYPEKVFPPGTMGLIHSSG